MLQSETPREIPTEPSPTQGTAGVTQGWRIAACPAAEPGAWGKALHPSVTCQHLA